MISKIFKFKKVFAVASVIAVTSMTQVAQAQPMMFERGGVKMMKMMARHLDLTELQKDQMRELLIGAKEGAEQRKIEFGNYQSQMKALIQADEFDEEAFNALNETYQPMFKEKALAKARMKHAMYQLLDAEQREKLETMKSKRSSKMRRVRSQF